MKIYGRYELEPAGEGRWTVTIDRKDERIVEHLALKGVTGTPVETDQQGEMKVVGTEYLDGSNQVRFTLVMTGGVRQR